MRSSNANLLAEIDTLEEITRKDAKDLEVVRYIESLEMKLAKAPEFYEMLEKYINLVEDDSAEDFLYEFQNIKELLAGVSDGRV